MQYLQEADLAWSLIEAAKPGLDIRERHHVFVSVGAGDSFTTIRILVKLIADKRIALQPSLIQSCTKWLDAYALHEDHERLRRLVEDFAVRRTNHQSGTIRRLRARAGHAVAVTLSTDKRKRTGSQTSALQLS